MICLKFDTKIISSSTSENFTLESISLPISSCVEILQFSFYTALNFCILAKEEDEFFLSMGNFDEIEWIEHDICDIESEIKLLPCADCFDFF